MPPSRRSPQPPSPGSNRTTATDLPIFTGEVPHQTEQAILLLRQALDDKVNELHARIDAIPPGLSLADIQRELSPTGSYPLPTAALLNTTEPPTNPDSGAPPTPVEDGLNSPPLPDEFLAIVTAAHDSMGIGPTSTDEEVFRFIQTVAQNINATVTLPGGLVCGLTSAPPGGDNVFTCAGETYRYARVTFSNDHTFKCLIDADPGGARTPEWADEGITAGLYRVATDPSGPC